MEKIAIINRLEHDLKVLGMALEVPRVTALVEFECHNLTPEDLDNTLGQHDTYRTAEVLYEVGYG